MPLEAPAVAGLDHVLGLQCLVCATSWSPDEVVDVCPTCGDDGILDVRYDHAAIAARTTRDDLQANPDPSMWRWLPLLPVRADSPRPPLRVGGTPLYDVPRLAELAGLTQVWVKDEGVQPTGSLKDRASAVAVVKARERGAAVVTTASTGNAAAALAGVAAAVEQATVIFVPAAAPEAKVAQLLAYGATVLLVDGTYDDAVVLCRAASREFGWYDRTTGRNPYMSEGKKTAAFELAEQLGWQVPDVVAVGVGDGCIIGALDKGFRDLLALGWIDRLPRLLGVQATGSAYLADAWRDGADVLTKPAIAAHTVADSISAGLPLDRLKAMRAVTETGGAFVTVDDDAILAAIPVLARASGVFAEPAAAAAWAGVQRAAFDGVLDPGDRVAVLSTGTGLKDVAAATRAVAAAGGRAHHVPLDLDAVAKVVTP